MGIEVLEDKIVISLDSNPDTNVTVLNYGATVISWKVNGLEQLWLSSAAKLDGTKPVRGGIPLVFPVFGKSKAAGFENLPQHGFARNSTWEFLGQTTENPPAGQFALSPDEANTEIYSKWNEGKNDFRLFLTVLLEEAALKTSIEVQNVGPKPFEFNWLFHSYLRTPDIEDTLVSNLPGETCYDQLVKQEYQEKAPVVQFHEEVDRIYKKIAEDKAIQVIYLGKAIHTTIRENLPDVVVWNPWVEKSGGMGDFEPKSGYKNMVCVEPGHVEDFVELKPQGIWKASQKLTFGKDINIESL